MNYFVFLIVPPLFIICYWLITRTIARSSSPDTKSLEYIIKGDQNAQKQYDNKKNDSSLAQDLIEASWKFLYAITDIISAKFSAEDIEELRNQGKVLLEFGATYDHVVTRNISHRKNHDMQKQNNEDLSKKI